jgi:hypothetical protein
MDWFEKLFGFKEQGYEETRRNLAVDGDRLRSNVNGKSYRIGRLELVSLAELRARVAEAAVAPGRLAVRIVTGDVRRMHHAPAVAGALFQVASQFNLLEMLGPDVTPEAGVTRYALDRTQGPACAVAAGAATVYRNYFAPVGEQLGQRANRQLDGLADFGAALSAATGRPRDRLWTMRNGYALCTTAGLQAIDGALQDPALRTTLAGTLRIGLHRDVEVTDAAPADHCVSQAFCSALPIAYNDDRRPALWKRFAQLVLDAAYEATLLAATLNAARGASRTVYLTRLGGGAFGNEDEWIDSAMRRALTLSAERPLDVCLGSYGAPSAALLAMVRDFSAT